MVQIEEAYVSFETAKLLKEKGFNEETRGYYPIKGDATRRLMFGSEYPHNNSQVQISAPTQQMAMRYLRETYNILISPKLVCFRGSKPSSRPYYKWIAEAISLPTGKVLHPDFLSAEYYDSYEQAADAETKYCLTNLIK